MIRSQANNAKEQNEVARAVRKGEAEHCDEPKGCDMPVADKDSTVGAG